MKQIIIIILLSAFTIIGFYVNREYWFGWIIKPDCTKTEIQEGVMVGIQELKNTPSGKDNVFYGYATMDSITTGTPCGGVGDAYKPIKK